MALFDLVRTTKTPATVESLSVQLVNLGLRPGECILLHSSLSALGWVCGGAIAAIEAILHVLGPNGTLMVPTHTPDNTEPSRWENPSVPSEWCDLIRTTMPPFDPQKTPAHHMGAIAESFRTYPGVVRSEHPIGSFAALGPRAESLLASHPLDEMFGDDSPLGALYREGGRVLLLGVGHTRNTSLHLAETRAQWPSKTMIREGTMMVVEGKSRWVEVDMIAWNNDDFSAIGQTYEDTFPIERGMVGLAEARLFEQAHMVDFATAWMRNHRV